MTCFDCSIFTQRRGSDRSLTYHVLTITRVGLLGCSIDQSYALVGDLKDDQSYHATYESAEDKGDDSILDLGSANALRILEGDSLESNSGSLNDTSTYVYDQEQSLYSTNQNSSNASFSSESYETSYNEAGLSYDGKSTTTGGDQYSNATAWNRFEPNPRQIFPDWSIGFVVFVGISGFLMTLTGGLVIAKRVDAAKVAVAQTASDAYHVFNQAKTFTGLKSTKEALEFEFMASTKVSSAERRCREDCSGQACDLFYDL